MTATCLGGRDTLVIRSPLEIQLSPKAQVVNPLASVSGEGLDKAVLLARTPNNQAAKTAGPRLHLQSPRRSEQRPWLGTGKL